ncbi:helix-turn-helix domain-containing protein [Citrobacter freundii]|nr:bacteriophage CI repressor [Citrobacter freundii]
MTKQKSEGFSFLGGGKESIQERLKSLFKGRSLRQASIDWGLPYSTLNNYFSKGATPGLDVVIRVAEIEGVSVGWLATGRDGVVMVDEAHRGTTTDMSLDTSNQERCYATAATTTKENTDDSGVSVAWNMIYDALSPGERVSLINLFVKIGAKGILEKIQRINEFDSAWERLDFEEKGRLIRLSEQLKKGSSEADQQTAETGLTSHDKKAG